MSKDYYLLEEETGATGFLAGVVDVISDNLGMILDYANALEADVFYVPDNDMSLLNDSVKKRLLYYSHKNGLNVSEDTINAIDFQLEESHSDVKEYVSNRMRHYCSSSILYDEVSEFIDTLKWYLQEPLCIYAPKKMRDKNIDILGEM